MITIKDVLDKFSGVFIWRKLNHPETTQSFREMYDALTAAVIKAICEENQLAQGTNIFKSLPYGTKLTENSRTLFNGACRSLGIE